MRHNYAARRQIRQLQATRAVMLQKAFNAFTLMTAYAIGVGGIGYMVVSAIKMMAP